MTAITAAVAGNGHNTAMVQICRTRIALRNILFATDFSPESAQALDCLRRLHTNYAARIYTVHVTDVFPFAFGNDPDGMEKAALIRALAATRLLDFMLDHGFKSPEFEPVILSGELFTQVEQFVESHDIDVIVLGTRGDAGISRLFNGSAAEEIFRTAKCPVMTVGPQISRRSPEESFQNLLFATDRSLHSQSAVPYIEWMLGRNPASRVTLLHVLPRVDHALEQLLSVPEIERELLQLISPDLQHKVSKVIVKRGEPAAAMVQAAREIEADLLVLGVRYGGAFLRAVTHSPFSITPEVIGRAPCPVLTIRSSESEL